MSLCWETGLCIRLNLLTNKCATGHCKSKLKLGSLCAFTWPLNYTKQPQDTNKSPLSSLSPAGRAVSRAACSQVLNWWAKAGLGEKRWTDLPQLLWGTGRLHSLTLNVKFCLPLHPFLSYWGDLKTPLGSLTAADYMNLHHVNTHGGSKSSLSVYNWTTTAQVPKTDSQCKN